MRYVSTRGDAPILGFDDVLLAGLARDGGLYVPETWPRFTPAEWKALAGLSYAEIAFRVLKPFVSGAIADGDLERMIADTYQGFGHPAVAPLKQIGANDYIIKALTPIEEFNEHFDCDLSDDEFDTIGGLVMQSFGHVPTRGESTALQKYQFKVLNADNRRIQLLRMNMVGFEN